MIKLKNSCIYSDAVVILGGASIIHNKYNLSLLSDKSNVIFIESKALTPDFTKYGVTPDYYFMPYPEKTRTNSLQHVFLQSISSGYKLEKSLKKKYLSAWAEFKNRFNEYGEIWRFEYPHKMFRIKKWIVLKDSPVFILKKFPNMKIITYDEAYKKDGFSELNIPNEIYKYTHSNVITDNIDTYFQPRVINNKLTISNMGFVNSAAISLYPILKYMGFKRVILIGMDMSMLGSMEFSAPYTFKSMKHYGKFFNASRRTFSHNFPRGVFRGVLYFGYSFYKEISALDFSKLFSLEKFSILYRDIFGLSGKFMREKNQLKDAGLIFKNSKMEFINIYEPFEFSQKIPGIKNISYKEYLRE